MPETSLSSPTYNLWYEPWITLEFFDGRIEHHGIAHTLLHAHEYKSIFEPSPLAVVGIHRLLTAILQSAINPENNADLKRLWQIKPRQFPADVIMRFGELYADRFDLFSQGAPFLQSADLPLQPTKGDNSKTVAYLAMEIPCGTAITHYRHGAEEAQCFCPACAAIGLVMIPAFATSGGAGIKPSINGVPPIYILPGGHSVFESLTASLLRPAYQPRMRSTERDDAWWTRHPVVGRSIEVLEVGYLHSLTFPARRVRLHPTKMVGVCTRCGKSHDLGVRTMIFDMGESRSKEAEIWFDPFAAYKRKGEEKPIPIRPSEGRALWRDFAALFLYKPTTDKNASCYRPTVLEQIAEITSGLGGDQHPYPFRCIGMRTDMKAKVFEWIDAGFDIPLALLRDPDAGPIVQAAVDFASSCASVISGAFRDALKDPNKKQSKSRRHEVVRHRMVGQYWGALAESFRQFIIHLVDPAEHPTTEQLWRDTVTQRAKIAFMAAFDTLGDDAETLRQRARGEKYCHIGLYKLAQKGNFACVKEL